MLSDLKMLQLIHQGSDMGVVGIRCVLPRAQEDTLRQALQSQLTEYKSIEQRSAGLLRSRRERPKGVNPMARVSSELFSIMKMAADPSPSKIAEMMIQGNTMGMVKSMRSLRDYQGKDPEVKQLAEKLLQTELHNIEEMKRYV